jgi:uncharacterized RDD family membrane protein YckC
MKEHLVEIILLYSFLKLVILVPYFTILESSSWQATIGKRIFKIKVVDLNGKRISFIKAIIRFFCKILSGQVLVIGFLMVAFTEKRQALHDLLAKTVDINKSSLPIK